jgi:hypothetical protein
MQPIPSRPSISPETISQAGAGALLFAAAALELWLAFWAAGWWHRCGAVLVAAVGAAVVARALVAVARERQATQGGRRYHERTRLASRFVEGGLVRPSPAWLAATSKASVEAG